MIFTVRKEPRRKCVMASGWFCLRILIAVALLTALFGLQAMVGGV